MIPRGADALLKMRITGQRPAAEVWVGVGDMREPDWWKWSNTADMPEILVRPEDPIERLDFRCLMGLRVILLTREWDDRAARIHAILEDYVEEIAVMSPAFELDVGWRWIKKYGRVEYGETHWISDYRAAQDDRAQAAYQNNQPAYSAATERENQIREAAPWLR